jgi:hypothetical protein
MQDHAPIASKKWRKDSCNVYVNGIYGKVHLHRFYPSDCIRRNQYIWWYCESAKDSTGELRWWHEQPGEKYFDYFVFNIADCGVNCGLLRSGARHRALVLTIGNAWGLDINSSQSTENHLQDLRFRRHQQRDYPNKARGLDNNFTSDRDCDSTTTTRLHLRRLRPRRQRRTR